MARGEIGNMASIELIVQRNKRTISTWTDEEKVRDHLLNPKSKVKVTPKLIHIIERWYYTADLIKKHMSFHKCVKLMTKKEWEDRGQISFSTARRDFNTAQRLFGQLANHDQRFHADLMLGKLEEDIKKARLDDDHKSIASFRKTQLELITEHMGGHEADEYKKLQPAMIVIGAFPEDLKTELPPKDEFKARMNKLLKPKEGSTWDASDADFEEVEDSNE